ncbi:ABC transporter ATP-binding protein [Desulfuromonas sp. AOP6]|uniref:metal ABC transporter ATP-binding protein n=1 Tax=Desulfuromonas sp. AOP6 TaxID=1566351 RepID=UPI001276802D|nr:ABC transporter ATP-binding protein [Desulfuromonas sp. AOP6]BCA80628.1 ABC transporter ATP-binding protein [Desulfuromonas sp. AOP6]
MSPAVIELAQVFFRYDEIPVLDNVTLSIEQGEFLGIVGPNGSGKSTLLKLILGLLSPTSGSVRVFGKQPGQACQKLGYVPQFATFDRRFPISVLDTVLQGRLGKTRSILGYGEKDRQVARQAMAEAEILDLQDRPLSTLSGGQRQRVLIARALACEPEVLILDEPTANIDPRVEAGVFDLLQRLNERVTVIVVSHDIGFISGYVSRVACLNRTLVCHATSDISGEVIENLYGMPMQMVHHHTVLKK